MHLTGVVLHSTKALQILVNEIAKINRMNLINFGKSNYRLI